MKSEVRSFSSEVGTAITDPWHHSQSWAAHGHQWQFTYNSFTANYTIENSDRTLSLNVPIRETDHYPSPQAWLDHWAKTKGKRQLKPCTRQSQQTSLLDFNPKISNSIPVKNPKGISFGQTLNQLYQGKTCTRRVWSDRTAKTFINYYEQGIKVPAYSKGLQYGGEIIGWLTLTEKPVQQPLVEMTQADLAAEGFPDYTFDQFLNEFFDGKNQTVWVICFEFTPNQTQETNVTVEVVESDDNQPLTDSDELTEEEERDLLHLERKVERAFYEAGKALCEIRDRQLYRTRHQTFETYVKERFSMKQSRSYQLMDAAIVVDNLLPKVPPMVEANDNSQKVPPMVEVSDDSNKVPPMVEVLPTSERQVRPLTKLEPDQQREAWAKAVEQAGGKVPSGRIVKNIVSQIRQRTPVPNPWRVNEVAMIMVKDNPDLRCKGGCWAVISEVHDFSCTVRLWDGGYQVKPENLKELPYSNEQQKAVRELCDRLSKITLDEVEKPMKDFLKGLGKIDRPWLTEFEEKVLTMLEENN